VVAAASDFAVAVETDMVSTPGEFCSCFNLKHSAAFYEIVMARVANRRNLSLCWNDPGPAPVFDRQARCAMQHICSVDGPIGVLARSVP
jgi:hypothetical protein